MGVTLEEILKSRDERRNFQQKLLAENPDHTLVVATVVIPGNEKRTEDSLIVAKAAVDALKRKFSGIIKTLIEKDLPTGYEAFLLVDTDEKKAKHLAIQIEEEEPIGRLFDIDVIDHDGIPMQRTKEGHNSRKCLICGNDARVCMRLGTHSIQELTDKIHQLAYEYVRGI